MHRVPTPYPPEQLLNVGWHALLRGDRSIQESVLTGRALRGRLRQVLAGIGPDLQVWDTVRMAQHREACGAPGARSVVYLDDLFSIRYTRMLEAMRRLPDADLNALGEFGQHLPGPARALAARPGFQRGLLRIERRLVARSEDRTARRSPGSLLINSDEAAHLRSRAGVADVGVLPPLLRTAATGAGRPRSYDGRPEFVFLGLLTLPHNASAVLSFLQGPWPQVLAQQPGARLRIIGRGADADLVAAVERAGSSVTLEGFVPDLDEALRSACALVNPLLFGSGVKLKVLEALARGLPVVSTTIGVEGIVTGPGQGCVVEDDPARLPIALLQLLDPAENAAVSAQAQRHYDAAFAPAAVHARYDEVFGTLAAAAS